MWWEKPRTGWENLLREPGPGTGTGRRLWKRGWGRGKERREGGRRKVRDGAKETAVLGVRHRAGDTDRSLARRGCPRCQMEHPAPSQVKTAGSEAAVKPEGKYCPRKGTAPRTANIFPASWTSPKAGVSAPQ